MSAECGEGDVIGAESTLGGAAAESATATVSAANTLTLAIDRSAAASLLPAEVAAALLGRPHPLALFERSASLGVPQSLDMVRVLARGGFGTVALATHRASGTQYAVKKVRKALVEPAPLRRQILTERAALASFDHP